MVYKRKKNAAKRRVYARKKTGYYRRRRYIRYNTPAGFSTGLPQRRVTKLRYCENITLAASGAGTLQTYLFRSNSVYDCNKTSTGGQPQGFQTWATRYRRYTVLGSRITVRLLPLQESAAYTVACGIYCGDSTAIPYTSYLRLIESGKGTWVLLNGGADKTRTVSSNFSAKKFFNLRSVKDSDRVGALCSANPADTSDFTIWWQAADGGAGPPAIQAIVTIDYVVSFSESIEVE